MSDWQELCETMNLDNDENALDQMIDQFIRDDSQTEQASFKSSEKDRVKLSGTRAASSTDSDEIPM